MRIRGLAVSGLLGMFPALALALGIESVTMRADDAGEPGETVEVRDPATEQLRKLTIQAIRPYNP